MIFILGWIRWAVAIPAALLILLSFFFGSKSHTAVLPRVTKNTGVTFAIVGIIICVWVCFSGVGGFVVQTADHLCRNEIFRILVEDNWPVQKDVLIDGVAQNRYLSYYIGFWMPAAVFGKVFGLNAGFVFQAIWAVLGIALVYVKLSEKVGFWKINSLLIFILFAGLDILGCVLVKKNIFTMPITEGIEAWAGFQYSGHTVQLFWVFNQAIYGWLLTLCILNESKNSRMILIWSCGLLECTFPFVGMLPVLVYKILSNMKKENPEGKLFTKTSVKELFSFGNVVGGGIIGIISFLYLFGNASAGNAGVEAAEYHRGTLVYILKVAAFVFVETGIYHLCLLKYQRKNPLFWISLGMLIICPFIRVGTSSDFCMRASIPALLVVCVMIIENLNLTWQKDRKWFCVLLAAFLIGCVTTVHEIGYAFKTGKQLTYVQDNILMPSNFSSASGSSFFMKYLAK